MAIPRTYLEFQARGQWRRWLEEHHAAAVEAWLILYKKKYQGGRLTLDEAVEEALCFGWIDGKLKSLDERSYALRFSPRRPGSIWSMSNIRRVEKLVAEGRMTRAGQMRINEAKENGEWDAAIRREQVDLIPPDLEASLSQHPGGITAYRELPDSRKKQYIYWLQSAKRAETRERRVQKILAEVLKLG